jgi:hypothetical protein
MISCRYLFQLTFGVLALLPSQLRGWSSDELAIHGFFSQGYLYSTDYDYLANTSDGTFEYYEAGVALSTDINDCLWVGVQFFGRTLGKDGRNKVCIDWGLADYHPNDCFGIRFGKIRRPYGLFNEVLDIDAARTFVLLPSSVYLEELRQYGIAHLGASCYGKFELPYCTSLEYEFYVGSLQIHAGDRIIRESIDSRLENIGGIGVIEPCVSSKYTFGLSLFLVQEDCNWKVGFSWQQAEFDTKYKTPVVYHNEDIFRLDSASMEKLKGWLSPIAPDPEHVFYSTMDFETKVQQGILSGQWSACDFTFSAEFQLRYFWTDILITIPVHPMLDAPPIKKLLDRNLIIESYYGMVEYFYNDCWTFGSYYSVFHRDRNQRSSKLFSTDDFAITARYMFSDNMLMKLEVHRMWGIGLLSGINGAPPPINGDTNWWLFAAKATVCF